MAKKVRKISMFVLMFVLVALMFPTATFANASAEENENQPYVLQSGEFDCYTDSEYLYDSTTGSNDENYSVYDYAEHLEELYPDNSLAEVEDTWLLKVIPEVLFQNEGEYFYIGKKYSFYIKYEETENRYFYYLMKTLVETKETNPTLIDGQVNFSLSPIAYNYCRYDATTRKILPVSTSYQESPTDSVSSFNRMKIKRVYLKDVAFIAQLNNKYHANQGQAEYVPNEDNGQFFIGIDYILNGSSLPNTTQYAIRSAKLFGGMIMSNIPVVGDIVELGLNIWEIIDIGIDYFTGSQKDFTEDYKMGMPNTFHWEQISKESQLSEYGALKKTTASGIQTSNTKPIVLRTNTDHYAGVSLFINETDIWEAILEMGVSLDIVEDDVPIIVENVTQVNPIATGVKSTALRMSTRTNEEAPQDLIENETEMGFSISGGEKKYDFLASRNGEYTFVYSNEDGATANIQIETQDGEVLSSLTNVVSGSEISNLQLVENERYVITVVNTSEARYSKFSVSMNFTPDELILGENVVTNGTTEDNYYAFKTTGIAYYDFTCGEGISLELFDANYMRIINPTLTNILLGDNQTIYIKVNFGVEEQNNVAISKSRKINYNYGDLPMQTLRYGEQIQLHTPESVGRVFNGWYIDDENRLITEADLWNYESSDIYLYPSWNLIEYTITFDEDGGTEVADVTYTVETPLFNLYDETEISKTGFTFIGWLDSNGNVVTYIESGNAQNLTFTAKWVETVQQITLDVNAVATNGMSATLSTTQVDVIYGQTFALPIPQIQGYTFNGWFNGNVQYTYADGASLATYIGESDIVLTASWSVNSFTIKVLINENINGQIQEVEYWIAEGGEISETQTQVGYSTNLCPHCVIRDNYATGRFNEQGKIFDDLVGVGIEGCWVQIFPNLENGAVIELAPTFINEVYTVDFDDFSQSELPAVQIEYGTEYELPIVSITGYDVWGWKVTDCVPNEIYNGTAFEIGSTFASNAVMPDITVGEQGNATIYLSVDKTGKEYSVTLQKDGAVLSVYTAIYGNVLSVALPPEKVGYSFVGWYRGAEMVINADGYSCNSAGVVQPWNINENITLTAVYTANKYYITYTDINRTQEVWYGEQVTLEYHEIIGYNLYWEFEGIELPVGGSFVYEYPYSIQATLKRDKKVYYITYVSDRSGATYNHTTYTYENLTNLGGAISIYEGDVFGGFYLDQAYTKRIYNITPESISGNNPIVAPNSNNIVLYVKWSTLYLGSTTRSEVYTITDKDFNGTPNDEIQIGLNYTDLENKRYEYVHFIIRITAKEVNDGYQQMKLFIRETASSSPLVLKEVEFEHVPGGKGTTSENYVWRASIPIANLLNREFIYLGYSARGSGEDDWKCEYVNIRYYLSYENTNTEVLIGS